MPEFERMPRDVKTLFSGERFAARHGVALPLITVDPEGYPRACLLSFGEIRARSNKDLAVAVASGSHTAANLIRRRAALIYYLGRHRAVWVQVLAGHGHNSSCSPDRQIFPLSVHRVKVDVTGPEEGPAELLTGPIFTAGNLDRLFSVPLFEELGHEAAP